MKDSKYALIYSFRAGLHSLELDYALLLIDITNSTNIVEHLTQVDVNALGLKKLLISVL